MGRQGSGSHLAGGSCTEAVQASTANLRVAGSSTQASDGGICISGVDCPSSFRRS